MATKNSEILKGTLDLLILTALRNGPVHGFGVSVRIGQLSRESLFVEQGSLYPALYRLENQGLIQAKWGVSENNRKARFYSLTTSGEAALEEERASWKRLSASINLVLRNA